MYDWTRWTLGQKTNTILISMRCSSAIPERHQVSNILPAGMHSCRPEWIPAGMGVLPFPFPQTTPGLAGGRRRRHRRLSIASSFSEKHRGLHSKI